MRRILSYLLIILIGVTGIACASACCDVDNITDDDNSIVIVNQIDTIEISDVDLNQDVDDDSAYEDIDDDLNQTADDDAVLDEDNFSSDVEIKSPVALSTALTQKDNALFYCINPNLNCTGNLSFTIKSGNQTCLNCDITLLGPNAFKVNQFSAYHSDILANQAVNYVITLCYSGDANHYPTMLSQNIVVDSSIISRFIVGIHNAISTTLMCVD